MDILKSLNCKVFSTVSQEEDEAAWRAARSRGVGGSDIGAICGVSNFSTARLIYLKKTGQYDDFDKADNLAKDRMRFGHLLEPVVADEFAVRSGKQIAVSPATLVHKDYPWALANIDRFIVDETGEPIGVLECKTAGEFMNEDWMEGDLPMSYQFQLQWYLWVTDLKYGAFACLVGGNKFYYYEVFRDDDLIKNVLFPIADKFWNYNVKNMIEPELSGAAADSDFIKEINCNVIRGSEKTLEGDSLNDLARTFKQCKAQIKELETIMDEAANRIKEQLGNTEIGYTSDYVTKWSPRSQVRIDTDKVKSMFPDVYEQCKKQINYRVFTVK